MARKKEVVEVLPVCYKLKNRRKYGYATTIRNLKTNKQITIDNKTLDIVHSVDCDYWNNLVISVGNVYFDFNRFLI